MICVASATDRFHGILRCSVRHAMFCTLSFWHGCGKMPGANHVRQTPRSCPTRSLLLAPNVTTAVPAVHSRPFFCSLFPQSREAKGAHFCLVRPTLSIQLNVIFAHPQMRSQKAVSVHERGEQTGVHPPPPLWLFFSHGYAKNMLRLSFCPSSSCGEGERKGEREGESDPLCAAAATHTKQWLPPTYDHPFAPLT